MNENGNLISILFALFGVVGIMLGVTISQHLELRDRRRAMSTPWKDSPTPEAEATPLPDLDLPTIPEGWYYRIVPFEMETSEYTLNVKLMKGASWKQTELGNSLSTSNRMDIERAARQALKNAEKALKRRETIADREPYIGTYDGSNR